MMRMLLLLVCLLTVNAASADETQGQEAEAAFFAGLDLKEAGDCEGAVARFQLSLSRDPDLHQARLHMAECYHSLGFDTEAVDELTRYLQADFPGRETERARQLLIECGGDPGALPTSAEDGGTRGDGGEDAGGTAGPRAATPWSPVRIETGAQLAHYANRVGLIAVGPLVDVRVLPWRFLELGVRAGLGFGAYEDHGGSVRVPEFGASAAASIPVGRVRIVAGVLVPMVVSRFDGTHRVDAGVVGEAGIRIALGETPLVIGAQVGGGYLVTPVIGGGIRVGVQLGGAGGAR